MLFNESSLSNIIRYSIEPRERHHVKGYGFLSFARRFGDKFGDKLIKQGSDTAKVVAKRALNKTAEATGDLIGNKIADKISRPKKVTKQATDEPKEIYIPPDKRQQIIDELKLIPKI